MLKNKEFYARIGMIIFIAVALVFALVYGAMSFAWFVDGSSAHGNGMSVALGGTKKYQLGTKGTGDDFLINYTLNDKTYEEGILSDGYYVTGGSTAVRLKMEDAIAEDNMLAPETYGKITFYVIADEQPHGEIVQVKLGLVGYQQNTPSSTSLTRSANDEIQQLLNGHVLFFGTKTGNTYSDFKENGEISVEMTDIIVEVTLYWVWSGYFTDYTDNSKWGEEDYNKIVHSITDDIDNARANAEYNSKYFSQVALDGIYIDSNEDGQVWHGDNIEWSRKAYLNDQYNEADQLIGLEFDYILLEIMLEE